MSASNTKNQKYFKIRKHITRKRVVALVIILLVIIGYRTYRARTATDELEVATVKKISIVESISASGDVSAEKSSDLAFLASGDIKEILVTNGQEVVAGQLLARVDSTNLSQAYYQAEADLRSAQATLDRVYDDVKGNDDDETFDQREARTAAEAAKDRAYRAFVIAQKNLANSSMRAPFPGIVSISESTSPGVYSSPVTVSFNVTDPSTIYFNAEVDESEINNITVDQKTIVELDAFADQQFEESVKFVSFISNFTSTGGTAYRVGITLPENTSKYIKLGMNGKANFITDSKENVLAVPDTSVVVENGSSYVWVVEGGKAKKYTVETGISSSDETEIVSGLTEGQSVIVRPPTKLTEGQSVNIK